VTLTPQALDKLKIVGKLNDRSILSDEMADLCANHPIYRVTEVDQKDADQMSDPGEANSEEGRKDKIKIRIFYTIRRSAIKRKHFGVKVGKSP